jgi:hypothetical protein
MDRPEVLAGTGHPAWQPAKSFTTATDHEDAATRRRADEHLRRWERVLRGMAGGTLTIGSRTPAAGLPAWVMPEVVRGGSATGEAAAGGPLTPHEAETARRVGVPAEDQIAVIAWMQEETRRHPGHVVRRLTPMLAGLRHVLVAGSLDDGTAPAARRFVGWGTVLH